MVKSKNEIRVVQDEAFKREAVRILASSDRTIVQVAEDLQFGREELMAGPHDDVHKELARLRRENTLLRAERDLLKNATVFFAKETSR